MHKNDRGPFALLHVSDTSDGQVSELTLAMKALRIHGGSLGVQVHGCLSVLKPVR